MEVSIIDTQHGERLCVVGDPLMVGACFIEFVHSCTPITIFYLSWSTNLGGLKLVVGFNSMSSDNRMAANFSYSYAKDFFEAYYRDNSQG